MDAKCNEKIMRDKAYQNIMGNQLSEEFNLDNYKEEEDEERSCNYYSYKSRADFLDEFVSGKPMSIVQKQDNTFGVIMGNGKVILELSREKYIENINGLHYHSWQMPSSTVETEVMFDVEIIQYCLLLPRFAISNDISHRNHFALITHNWMEMNETGNIQLPSLPTESSE